MAKDRARPFSKKHRKYWIPVTGGMLLIGGINVGIGMCAYDKGPDQVQRIEPVIPVNPDPGPSQVILGEGMIGLGEIPVPVMRAFTKAHPQRAPQAAKKVGDGAGEIVEVYYLEDGARRVARYRPDGTLP
ncbi:MAG: hypothetical protein ACKV2T_13045 [Kofleriaceae bacterium]